MPDRAADTPDSGKVATDPDENAGGPRAYVIAGVVALTVFLGAFFALGKGVRAKAPTSGFADVPDAGRDLRS